MKKDLVLFNSDLKEEDILLTLQIMDKIKECLETLGTYGIIADVNTDIAKPLQETLIGKFTDCHQLERH